MPAKEGAIEHNPRRALAERPSPLERPSVGAGAKGGKAAPGRPPDAIRALL